MNFQSNLIEVEKNTSDAQDPLNSEGIYWVFTQILAKKVNMNPSEVNCIFTRHYHHFHRLSAVSPVVGCCEWMPGPHLLYPSRNRQMFRWQYFQDEKRLIWKHCHYWSVWAEVPEQNGFWHGWPGPDRHGNIHSWLQKGVFWGPPQWERCVWSNDQPSSLPSSSPGWTLLPNGKTIQFPFIQYYWTAYLDWILMWPIIKVTPELIVYTPKINIFSKNKMKNEDKTNVIRNENNYYNRTWVSTKIIKGRIERKGRII